MAGAGDEMDKTTTLKQFQQYVWDQLPPRRLKAGQEVVGDIVALAIQEWPVDLLVKYENNPEERDEILRKLALSIKRQAEFVYGQKRFAGLWIAALQILIPIIVQIILDWWLKRKDNQARLIIWRRRWKVDRDG